MGQLKKEYVYIEQMYILYNIKKTTLALLNMKKAGSLKKLNFAYKNQSSILCTLKNLCYMTFDCFVKLTN